jgi:hypothetical protein
MQMNHNAAYALSQMVKTLAAVKVRIFLFAGKTSHHRILRIRKRPFFLSGKHHFLNTASRTDISMLLFIYIKYTSDRISAGLRPGNGPDVQTAGRYDREKW